MRSHSNLPANVDAPALTLVIVALLFFSCDKNNAVVPRLHLATTGTRDSSFAAYNETIPYQTTVAATWRKTNNGPGTVTSNGIFTAGNTEGVVTMEVMNDADSSDRLSLLVLVSKHAPEFIEMKKGGFILSFRHCDATNGTDLPTSGQWWRSCDPLVARQLTVPTGYTDADSIGQVLRLLQRMHVEFDTIMTSEFCRCRQTAEGFNLAGLPIKESPTLTYFMYDEKNRYPNTMALYASLPLNHKNYIAVTHAGFTGTMPAPAHLNQLAWGDAALFHLNPETGSMPYSSNVTIGDWKALARR